MSISLQEAHILLEDIPQLKSNPELVFTHFSGTVAENNFLLQVNVDGEHFSKYLINCLSNLPVFKDCIIKNETSGNFKIYVQHLCFGRWDRFASGDKIAEIDIENKQFKFFSKCIEDYQVVLNQEYTLKEAEVSDMVKKLEDLRFLSRIKKAGLSFTEDIPIKARILNSLFWIYCPIKKKKILQKVEYEYKNIERINAKNKAEYEDKIGRQNLYREKAPEHIAFIQQKQNEIEMFLSKMQYSHIR